MKVFKILNLYAGIGENRKPWPDKLFRNCDYPDGTSVEITAVEIVPEIAEIYKQLHPKDTMIIGDSIAYLEKNYMCFDFIWASPPCQSHGQYRHNVGVLGKGFNPIMPDMNLYAIIVFLKTYFKGLWCVENTVPYYEYLINPSVILQRHPIWANFQIEQKDFKKDAIRTKNKISDFDNYEIIAKSKIKNKRQVLRNCVCSEIGEYIFNRLLEVA